MPQTIAKHTTVCRVCGGQIVAGIHTVRFTAVPGSARHVECFGKKDKFAPNGKPLSASPMPGLPMKALPQPKTGLDEFVPSWKADASPFEAIDVDGEEDNGFGSSTQDMSNDDDGTPPWESKPSAGEKKQNDMMNGKGYNQPDESGDEEEDDTPASQGKDQMAEALANAIKPFIERRLKKHEASVKNQVDQALKSSPKVNTQALIQPAVEAAHKAALNVAQSALKSVEQEIGEKVQKAMEEKGTITIVVKTPEGQEVGKLEGLNHKDTQKLLRLMTMRKNVYMPGPTGSGKSTAARKCSSAIKTKAHPDGLPFYYISLNPQSSPTRIEGYQTPHGEYVLTLFRKAYEFGGVYCADEVDNSMANLWTSINNAIDSDLGSFPDGLVKRHPDFVFVGTGNTNLSGDAIYRDRKALDKATISRFVFLKWDYDLALEKAITLGRNKLALPWMNWVVRVRDWAKINNPSLYAYAHPRASYDGADLLGAGFTPDETANMTVFKETFDPTALKAVLAACPLPTQNMKL